MRDRYQTRLGTARTLDFVHDAVLGRLSSSQGLDVLQHDDGQRCADGDLACGPLFLLGRLGVTDVSVGEPDGSCIVIDAEPEPATCRHLVLPLLHLDTVDASPAQ